MGSSEPGVVPSNDGARQSESLWSRPYRQASAGLFSLAFLEAYSVTAITTAMPRAASELDGLALYGLAFAATLATSVVSMALAAPWIDRSGPGAPLFAGLGLFSAGLLLAAGAGSMEWLVLGRAVQGLGLGLDAVALYVVIARVFPPAIRARMFAALAAAWVLPTVVGPAISGAVTDRLGWRWVFLTVPVLAVVSAALLRAGTGGAVLRGAGPGPLPQGGRRHDWRPAFALAAAAAVLAVADAGQRRSSWWVPELAAAMLVLVAVAPRLLPPGTWQARRGLPAVVLMRALLGTAFTVADVYLPLLMIQQRNLPAWLAGLSLTVGGITWSCGSWLAGRARLPSAVLLRAGSWVLLLGIGVAGLVAQPEIPAWVAWLGWALAGLGIGTCYPTLSVLLLERSVPADQGRNAASLQLNETLTSAAVLAVVGAVFAALLAVGGQGFLLAFTVAAVLALAGALVSGRA
jgi:MFS family permease